MEMQRSGRVWRSGRRVGEFGEFGEGGEKAEIVLVFVCVTLRLDNTFKNNKYLLRV